MGRRNTNGNVVETVPAESNGDASGESRGPLTSAQRLAASAASSVEVSADPFAAEAKYFTEHRVLSRDVSFLHVYLYFFHLGLILIFEAESCRFGLFLKVLTSSTT